MLAKKKRLSKREISENISKAKNFRGKFLLLKIVGANVLKTGVSVSKRVSKSAVKRNSLRRSVYRVISKNINKISPAHLFFVFNFPATAKEIEEDVLSLLEKAKIIN